MRLFRVGAWALTAGLFAASAVSAQDYPTMRLTMAHFYTPGNIWFDAGEAFSKAVTARTGGKVTMRIDHSGSTGDWPKAIEGLLIGTNDIVIQSVGTLDRYNIVAGIEAYPYLVRDLDHFKKVFYGPVGRELYADIAKKTRFAIVGAGYRGARHLSSSRNVTKVEELKGLKLRVPPLKMYRLTWDYLGASPVPMGAAEIFTSLQQGVVDGQENPLEVLEQLKLFEVQKFVIETAHIIGAMTFIFSDAKFRALPPAVRTVLQEEGDKAMLAATARMEKQEGELKAFLQSKGMTFTKVDTAAFQAKLTPMQKDFPELAEWVQKIQAVK